MFVTEYSHQYYQKGGRCVSVNLCPKESWSLPYSQKMSPLLALDYILQGTLSALDLGALSLSTVLHKDSIWQREEAAHHSAE
jgi:hypothetical protein